MLGLVLGALWRRRAQTLLLLLLAAVTAGGAASAPGYAIASLQSLAAASVVDSTTAERVITARAERDLTQDVAGQLAAFTEQVSAELDLPDFTVVTGAGMVAVLEQQLHRLTYRQDVCERVSIDGACPRAPREVLVEAGLARSLGIDAGESVRLRGRTEAPAVEMRVVGLYRAIDPSDAYWGRSLDGSAGEHLTDALFTPLETFRDLRPNRVELTADATATPTAFRRNDPVRLAFTAQQGIARLGASGITVTSDLGAISDRFRQEQQAVYDGVAVGAGELLVICWLVLFLALRQTAQARRGDIGLLTLRGARRLDVWSLVAAQSLLPLALGGAAGLAAGPLVARWLAGPIIDEPTRVTAFSASIAAALIAVAGAAVAALAAERRLLRTSSVASLGRQTTAGGQARRWVLDALVVVLAGAGIYQLTAGRDSGGRGWELLTPLLLALAAGLVAVRLITLGAGRVGRRALRAGHLGTGLAAMHLARRAGTSAVFGAVVVVIAVLVTTTLSWSVSAAAHHQRAVAEVGADRILTVRATNPTHLLAAVREADPQGRHAMAAIVTDTVSTTVLAVDTTRLAAVAGWLSSYALPSWEELAGELHPDGYSPVSVRAAQLVLDATWSSAAPPQRGPVPRSVGTGRLVATLAKADGDPVNVEFGPLRPGRRSYAAQRVACADGCRLVSLALVAGPDAPARSAVTVHALGAGVDDVLADRTRWRGDVRADAPVAEIAAGPDGLTIGLAPAAAPASANGPASDATAYVLDAPTPLPVARSRRAEVGTGIEPRSVLTGERGSLPVRVVADGRALPQISEGLLVDLEYAQRLSTGAEATSARAAIMQVWLAPGAPPQIQQSLAAAGVSVLAESSIAAREAELDARGPSVALRFMVIVAGIGLALVLTSFVVALAVERRTRAAELAALRRQGVAHLVMARVGIGGHVLLGVLAVVVGAAAGVALYALIPAPLPAFTDDWRVLDMPAASAAALVVVTVGAAAAVTLVAAIGGAQLIAATRRLVGQAP